MVMERNLLDIISTDGYTALIEGEPGQGKTTISLAACALKGSCKYISYAEPEHSLKKKLSNIEKGEMAKLDVMSAVTGEPSRVFSEIISGLSEGKLVIVDSLDALMYSLKDEGEMRSFLQILYGSSKQKKGSLLFISENVNPASRHVRFICDALVSLDSVEVLGSYVRRARVIKDRDYQIKNRFYYYAISDKLKIFTPSQVYHTQKMKALKTFKRPPEGVVDAEIALGYNILYDVDYSVSDLMLKVFREALAADYLRSGYSVDYWLGPQESEEEVIKSVRQLAGSNIDKLKTIYVDPQEFEYNSDEFLRNIVSAYGRDNAVDIIHLLSQEDFAVKQPMEYERFVKNATKENLKLKRITILFGYSNQEALRIRAKYSNILRKIIIKDGFLFWRSLRPLGNVYLADFKLEKGYVSFEEMF
ncbi:MAG: ATPase domain-containing protein [Conexivisphaerales archaeon]|nr:ATPase domain-containing protein [Conexivisphaerales archaeon]